MDKRGSCRRRASSPLLDRGILHDEEAPGLEIRAARGRDPGHEGLADELIGHGIEREAAHRVHGLHARVFLALNRREDHAQHTMRAP